MTKAKKKTKTNTQTKTNTKTKTERETKTKTKTKTRNEIGPTYAIFSEIIGCKDIKYDLFSKNVKCRMSNVECRILSRYFHTSY